MVQSGSMAVGADLAPAMARSITITASQASTRGFSASSSARASGRRPGAMTRRAAVSVSPSARWSAISRASVAVRNWPSRHAGPQSAVGAGPSADTGPAEGMASADVAEEAKVASWQVDEEPPVEEPVRALAGGFRGHDAAVAGRTVQELLRVLRSSHRADGVRRAAGSPVEGGGEDPRKADRLALLYQSAQSAVAVGRCRHDQQTCRSFATHGLGPRV